MSDAPYSALGRLYAQFDVIARGRDVHGDSGQVHAAILAQLDADRAVAATSGWTSLEIERTGGSGRLQLVGIAPGARQRSVVADGIPRPRA